MSTTTRSYFENAQLSHQAVGHHLRLPGAFLGVKKSPVEETSLHSWHILASLFLQ